MWRRTSELAKGSDVSLVCLLSGRDRNQNPDGRLHYVTIWWDGLLPVDYGLVRPAVTTRNRLRTVSDSTIFATRRLTPVGFPAVVRQ